MELCPRIDTSKPINTGRANFKNPDGCEAAAFLRTKLRITFTSLFLATIRDRKRKSEVRCGIAKTTFKVDLHPQESPRNYETRCLR